MRTRTAPGHGIAAKSSQARIAMVSTHGYVAANPPLGAADTGGQIVYILELSRKLALLGYPVDIWTRRDRPDKIVSQHPALTRNAHRRGRSASAPVRARGRA